jgi:hypothetical protein
MNEKADLNFGAIHGLLKKSPMFLYIAAVHVLCLTLYILIPFSDKPVIFYVTLRRSLAHFSCLTYEKTLVLIGTIPLLVMRFTSRLVNIQIPFTLKMEAARSCELLVELHASYTLHSVTTRQNTVFFRVWLDRFFLEYFPFHSTNTPNAYTSVTGLHPKSPVMLHDNLQNLTKLSFLLLQSRDKSYCIGKGIRVFTPLQLQKHTDLRAHEFAHSPLLVASA